jgi:exopolyphosphatase/guanosine-5'-triphosphate,3'-diphosphate pyrophosphatase
MTPRHQSRVAAIDLGSNSFHLIVARAGDGQLHILDRMRERVLLAVGLDAKGNLSAAAQERALRALRLFGQRVAHMPEESVRVVGTNTLRRARNAKPFLRRAHKVLGHPIEVISGREEARLIYLGVAHSVAETQGRRLVIDIGGGSTECVIGKHFEPLAADSLYMGCVSYSLGFFPGGRIRHEHLERAEIAARLEFETLASRYSAMKWKECLGSSGTILATEQVLRVNNWSDRGITREALQKLRKALIQVGNVDALAQMRGIPADRASVYPGGFAILNAAFEAFGISRMMTATGALREGLIYDLLGRFGHEDVRDATVHQFAERYGVDFEQAARVERTALEFLRAAAEEWDLQRSTSRQYLSWASRLAEVGLSISYNGYHKHSAYIVSNADMPGFSREGQTFLAALIRGHRRKVADAMFRDVTEEQQRDAKCLCVLLRLATRLHRGRRARAVPRIRLIVAKHRIDLHFPRGWLAQHPLTRADLGNEANRLQPLGIELSAS